MDSENESVRGILNAADTAKYRNVWLSMDPVLLLSECEQNFHLSGGHGGQKVNKTSVAVLLIHKKTGLTVTDNASRSQAENRLHALRKLRWEMVLKIRNDFTEAAGFTFDPPPSVHNEKRFFWSAVVLDAWYAAGWEPRETAQKLGVSVSRLMRIVYRDPLLWQEINRSREQLGLHSLKGNG